MTYDIVGHQACPKCGEDMADYPADDFHGLPRLWRCSHWHSVPVRRDQILRLNGYPGTLADAEKEAPRD